MPEDKEVRTLPVGTFEIRHTGKTTEGFTMTGYPIVYGQRSHDLGGFTEVIEEGALDEVLASQPDVHLDWDHDTRYVGARTTNGTLTLGSDHHGVHMNAQVGNYSWAKDLRVALERRDIDQGSFAFTVAPGGDEFSVGDDGTVTRTVRKIDHLYNVTVTAQGAYPQTSMAAMRSLAAATGSPPEDTPEEEEPSDPVIAEGGTRPEGEESEDPAYEELAARSLVRKAELAQMRERLEKLR